MRFIDGVNRPNPPSQYVGASTHPYHNSTQPTHNPPTPTHKQALRRPGRARLNPARAAIQRAARLGRRGDGTGAVGGENGGHVLYGGGAVRGGWVGGWVWLKGRWWAWFAATGVLPYARTHSERVADADSLPFPSFTLHLTEAEPVHSRQGGGVPRRGPAQGGHPAVGGRFILYGGVDMSLRG